MIGSWSNVYIYTINSNATLMMTQSEGQKARSNCNYVKKVLALTKIEGEPMSKSKRQNQTCSLWQHKRDLCLLGVNALVQVQKITDEVWKPLKFLQTDKILIGLVLRCMFLKAAFILKIIIFFTITFKKTKSFSNNRLCTAQHTKPRVRECSRQPPNF